MLYREFCFVEKGYCVREISCLGGLRCDGIDVGDYGSGDVLIGTRGRRA